MQRYWLTNMFTDKGRKRKRNWTVEWPWIKRLDRASLHVQSSDIEVELSDYHRLPDQENSSPLDLLQEERTTIEVISNLDEFFGRLYKYYCGKGLWCIVIRWIVELCSLGFTICFSGFFLLLVNWDVLQICGANAVEPCDLVKEAINEHPLEPFTISKIIVVIYLLLFSLYWLFCFLHFFSHLRHTLEARHFYRYCLCISDRELQTTSWPVLLDKIVQYQQQQRLCVVRQLSAHDVVMCIMRKDNYLIGMLNKGVLAVALPSWIPGSGPVLHRESDGTERRLLLTKTLEWSLNWCILHQMFDSNFLIRKDFIDNPVMLKRRLRVVGLTMLVLSPFLVIFMLVYFFLRHAEEFYHHPSIVASRRWSNLAKWVFREFNELEHLFNQRLNCSYKHAVEYMKQFPSVVLSLLAKFVSFVAGGFAAILIIVAFFDESLLEAHIFGRNLLWFAAVFGTITAISRSFIIEEFQIFQPEFALKLVACFTHYMPKHWRGAENKDNVQAEFESLFQSTGMTLLEDLFSIFATPYTLLLLLPLRVDDILHFIKNFTVHIEGIGDVCRLSVFDFEHHGNKNYGSPFHTTKEMRSCQGKLEKSFLNFQSSYPNWDPPDTGKRFLSILSDSWSPQSPHMGFPGSSQYVHATRPDCFHPSYAKQLPFYPSSSLRDLQSLQQLQHYKEENSLGDGSLVDNLMYWVVDRFYASQTDSRSGYQPPMPGTADMDDNYLPDATVACSANANSDFERVGNSIHNDPSETSDLQALNGTKGSDFLAYEHYDGHKRNEPFYHGQSEWCHSTMPAAQTSMQAHGGFLEPPTFPTEISDIHALNRSKRFEYLPYEHCDESRRNECFHCVQGEWSQSTMPAMGTSALAHESFLEPPMFPTQHFTGSGYGSSLDTEDHQEREGNFMYSHGVNTTSSAVLEDKVCPDFDLPFGDLYDYSQGGSSGHQRKELS